MTATTTAWESVPAVEVLPGVTRQTVSGTSATVVRYSYAPGSVFPIHSHREEQITVVHSGRIVFTVEDDELELGAGQIAVIAGGVPHGARVIGEELVVTDNYIPSGQRAPLRIEER
jgi:quercetin dioxygenase-like cupin family protein